MIKNQAITAVHYFATNSDGAVVEDPTAVPTLHSIEVIGDGGRHGSGITATPAKVDGTNAPGLYKVALTAAENNYDFVTVCGKSATSGVTISPVSWTNVANIAAVNGLDMSPTHTATVKAGSGSGAIKLVNIEGQTAMSSVDDFYKDRFMVFVTGNLAGQARRVKSYTGSALTANTDGDCTAVPDTGSIIKFM